jgi:SpoVK/Ycf46/Vps4 family AAA+-type ATPase
MVKRLIESAPGALFVAGRERRRHVERPTIALEVRRPTAQEQRIVWRQALGATADGVNGRIEALTAQFSLSAPAIRAAATEALATEALAQPADLAAALWNACREQARPRLDDLAQRLAPAAGWDDLVLPAEQRQALREIAAHVRQRARVYDAWGFAGRGTRGLGISALFAGASGTGKTMAAEVLAGELRLDLYRIDLSALVSKYIGETEKNLRRVFDAAEDGGAVLLFDEADALFGKRSEVKDSHDRYANIEISYLLQRMEAYRGLAILTTNLRDALDPAFLRRLRFVVSFPFPDAALRAELWRRAFPKETPTSGLNVAKLARLNVTGGNIRNIALYAAFQAAEAGETVGMPHLLRAAQAEYAKLERPLSESETGGWL